jgi:hypothetical protein
MATLLAPISSSLVLAQPLPLDSGQALERVTVAYETYGELAADKSNAILVHHALTGDLPQVRDGTGLDGAESSLGLALPDRHEVSVADAGGLRDFEPDEKLHFALLLRTVGRPYRR